MIDMLCLKNSTFWQQNQPFLLSLTHRHPH
jgi:hypothetical protein